MYKITTTYSCDRCLKEVEDRTRLIGISIRFDCPIHVSLAEKVRLMWEKIKGNGDKSQYFRREVCIDCYKCIAELSADFIDVITNSKLMRVRYRT